MPHKPGFRDFPLGDLLYCQVLLRPKTFPFLRFLDRVQTVQLFIDREPDRHGRYSMNVVRNIVLIIAVLIIGYYAVVSYLLSQGSASLQETWKKMKSRKLQCPARMEVRTERWAQVGYSRTCVNLRHGTWEAWEEGSKRIDGYYEHGQKHGTWVFYNSDGSVSKEIEYNQGTEVPSSSVVKESE